jgi:hypothetical protein
MVIEPSSKQLKQEIEDFLLLGLENFCDDVEFMSKNKISPYWRINWAVLTPGKSS